MNYFDWNTKLIERFFTPDCEGQRVFLSVTKDLIEELGGENGVQDFIAAVKTGPGEAARANSALCTRLLETTKRWRQKGAPGDPPYIATLALFVLAASYDCDEEKESRGYHKRLRELLGEPVNYTPIHNFYLCISVWDDLETWSSHDQAGTRGMFHVDFSGSWMYVGIPNSQTLLTEKERASLGEVFFAADLDPAIQYSDAYIASAVAEHGRGHLLKRTIRRLSGEVGASEGLRDALLERLHDELAQWQSPDYSPGDDTQAERVGRNRPTRVLVSLQYHTVARSVQTRLFFDGRGLDADSSFNLSSSRSGKIFSVEVERRSWSQPFQLNGYVAQATELDWLAGDELNGFGASLKFIFVGDVVRIFESGTEGVAHLMERGRLPAQGPFWLAIASQAAEVIEWGQNNCRDWQEVRVDAGLPTGWRLFKAAQAISTAGIEKKHPSLCLPIFAKIVLTGGLKLGKSSRYLSSMPPQLVAQTPPGDFSLTCNGQDLPIGSLPVRIPSALLQERNVVELRDTRNPDKTRKCSFYLVQTESLPWKSGVEFGCSARNGGRACDSGARVSGALVLDWQAPELPVQESLDGESVVLLGRKPGQIAGSGDLIDWSPVWIVSKGRNRRVFFCGNTAETSAPETGRADDRKAVRKWREIVYFGRRSIQPPRHRRLAALWSNYVTLAKDV